jgi:putative proteasome-type protease
MYSKMFRFELPGQRVFGLLTAGNLATSQAVLLQVKRDIKRGNVPNLFSVDHISEAADYLGELSREQQQKFITAAAGGGVDTSASFVLSGQIGTSKPRIYLIYAEGNYISATPETPYLQIGEVKYGKPILDRIIKHDPPLEEAATCALVSMDSTMKSNATVGPPIEMLIYRRDSLKYDQHVTFTAEHPYLLELRANWNQALRDAFEVMPRFQGPYDPIEP